MRKSILAIVAIVGLLSACTRIETGEIGLRIDASKQIQGAELQPGSFNQTLIGDVLTFPVRDINIDVEDKQFLTADNSALKDFDYSVGYVINTSSVSDLWTKQPRSFHVPYNGDTYLMYNYITTVTNNAAYVTVRKYKALEVADKRQAIEEEVKRIVNDTIRNDKLDGSVTVTRVVVRAIQPAQSIIDSANAVVKAENELRVKQTEVDIAKKEAERMAALANNSEKSIAYMNAQAGLLVAQGIANGKVQTIVVPSDFKGMVNVGK
jgi:regulator of protease activity HflC (stomatin/prohibitin superfamily)